MTHRFRTNPIEVMVRAYRDEPVCLTAVCATDKYVEVVGEDPLKSIGIRWDFAFQFSDAEFAALKEAFERGDQDELTALWGKAVPFSPVVDKEK